MAKYGFTGVPSCDNVGTQYAAVSKAVTHVLLWPSRVSTVESGPVVVLPKKSCRCQKVVLPGATIGSTVARLASAQVAKNSPLPDGP